MIFHSRVKVVCPRVLPHEFLWRLLDALVWQDLVPVNSLATDRASKLALFVVVAILVRQLFSCLILLNVKVFLDRGSLICLTALNEDRVCHEVTWYRAEQVVWRLKLFLGYQSFAWHDFSDRVDKGLSCNSLILWYLLDDLELAQGTQFLLEVSQGSLLVAFCVN